MPTLIANDDDAGGTASDVGSDFLYKPVEAPQVDAERRPPQIIGEKSGRIYFLEIRDVEYLASAGNYLVAHVGASEYLARVTLKHMSERLAPLGFLQIERSLLVNLRQVAHVERQDRGQFCFVMRGGSRLLSSRERSSDIRALLLGAMTPSHA